MYIWYDKSYGKSGPIFESDYIILTNLKKLSLVKSNIFYITLNMDKFISLIPKKFHSMINNFNSKKLFTNLMINNNLAQYIPITIHSDPFFYPCIIKPVYGISSIDTVIFKNNAEYDKSLIKYNSDFIVQEYIESVTTCVAHVLCDNGVIIKSVIYHALTPEKFYIKKGRIMKYDKRNINDCESVIFTKILSINNYHGICDIDYVYDINNNLKIFEINPRVGGSLFCDSDDFHSFMKSVDSNNIYYS